MSDPSIQRGTVFNANKLDQSLHVSTTTNQNQDRKKFVESKINSKEVSHDVINELIKQNLEDHNTSNDSIGFNKPSQSIKRDQFNNIDNNLQQNQQNKIEKDLMKSKLPSSFTKATESYQPLPQESSNASIQNQQVDNSFKGSRGSKTPKVSSKQGDEMRKSQTKSDVAKKFEQEQFGLSKVNSEKVQIKSVPLKNMPTKRAKHLGVIPEADELKSNRRQSNENQRSQLSSFGGSRQTNPKNQNIDPKLIEQKKNELQRQRLKRQDLVKKLNKALDKSRAKVEQILKHQDILENKQIVEEADLVGIQKKYQSSEKEQRQHGLPLFFYIMRKNFEYSYQEFLLLITHGHLQQAYTLCLSDGFIKAHDYQIKNMLVFEEFYKKNNYEFPRYLMEKKPSGKVLLGKQKSLISVKYEHGYKFKNGYLFNFIKKMIMLSNDGKSQENNKNQATPNGNDEQNGANSQQIGQKTISYLKMIQK